MAGSADGEGVRGELYTEHHVQLHRYEAQSDDWDHPIFECVCWASGVLLCEDLDQVSGEIQPSEAALYKAGEHCDSDLCCSQLWHRLQW